MSISQSKYILITSGVGGVAVAGQRELIARLMTNNELAPVGAIMEFGGGADAALANVGSYFGTTSEEYKFAAKYFSFVSKKVRKAKKISFARYTPAAVAPMLISMITIPALSAFTAVTNGSMVINMGGTSFNIVNLDLSGATDLSTVATDIQNAIQANTAGGELWTAATVTFANNRFTLTGGETGATAMAVATSTGTGVDISNLVGWGLASSPVVSDGAEAETLTSALDRIANTSNNFFSFDFIPVLTNDEIAEVSTWTDVQNVKYMFSHAVNMNDYVTVQQEVAGKSGTGLTLDKFTDYANYMPMAVIAAIDYTKPNAAVNMMFQRFDADNASVTDDTLSNTMDALLINYLGETQQAGQPIKFYQRGVLQGSISDMAVFANEAWLKDAFTVEFFNLLLALDQIPANSSGAASARGVMIDVLTLAKTNGVVSIDKPLTSVQKAYITSVTDDPDAWREVQANGYWLYVTVESYQNNGITEYKIDYVLIYGKGDSIRKVEGSDILI